MTRRTAFLFPGQGVLPKKLPPTAPEIDPLFDLAASHGLDLRAWMEAGDHDRLFPTDVAQPAILIDSVAHDIALKQAGYAPDLVAGHSLGEYSALVSANVLEPADALELVIERGSLMSKVSGAMAAIVKLELDAVTDLCDEAGPDVVIANHNGTHQVVISGTEEAVARVIVKAEAAGGRGIPLKVSGPFHSPFMSAARDTLADRIDRTRFRSPTVPIVCGVSGRIESDPQRLRALMRDQMTACVRWVDVLDRLVEQDIDRAIESGSGKVLVGLGRRHTERIEFLTYEEAADAKL